MKEQPGQIQQTKQNEKNEQIREDKAEKKTIFSGVQPSGILTLGNYLGALKNWVMLQDSHNCIYCVVDMHALTVRQVPTQLRRHAYEALAVYIACGIDPDKCVLFMQSHVPAHAELSWILSCYTMFGELSRMTQFKDKSVKNADNINAGLFTYPVLMAADILLYQADLVPVGDDQRQHIEITRDIAERFNGIYGQTFTVPEGFIPTTGMRIMSLTEPEKKMSKSDDNVNAYISILDSRDAIMRKFRRAVTDSESSVHRGEGKDGINNLMKIYSCITGKNDSEIEALFEGSGYGEFKTAVGEVVADALAPVKIRFDELMSDKGYLESIIKRGAENAADIAAGTLSKVYRKIGFTQIKCKS